MSFFNKLARSGALPVPTPADVDVDTYNAAIVAADAADVVEQPADEIEAVVKKRRVAAGAGATALDRAVAPPPAAFVATTLGGRKLVGPTFRAVFQSAKVIGDVFGAIAALAEWIPLVIEPTGMTIRLLDHSNILYLKVVLPKSAFLVYENAIETATTVVFAGLAFQSRKAQLTAESTLTFGFHALASESNNLYFLLYPRTGVARDGLVSSFVVPMPDKADYETLDTVDDSDFYNYEITIGLALLLKVVGYFKNSMGTVSFTITDHSIDIAGQCDGNTRQTTQIHFTEARNDTASVEAALTARPNNCHCQVVRAPESEQMRVVGYSVSLLYLRRTLCTLTGCRFVRLSFGRSARHSGEYSPLRVVGEHFLAGSSVCELTMYIAHAIEMDN